MNNNSNTPTVKQINLEKEIQRYQCYISASLDCISIALKDGDEERVKELTANAVFTNNAMNSAKRELTALKRLHKELTPTERALLKDIQYSEIDGPAVGYGEWTTKGCDAFTLGILSELCQKGIVKDVTPDEGETYYISTDDAPIL